MNNYYKEVSKCCEKDIIWSKGAYLNSFEPVCSNCNKNCNVIMLPTAPYTDKDIELMKDWLKTRNIKDMKDKQ